MSFCSNLGLSPRSEIILSILSYSVCSGTLVLVNKLSVTKLPYPSLVACVQLVFTMTFIYLASFLGWLVVDPIKWKYVVPYLAYTVAFSLGVYCNMKSLQYSNVETVIVFRALSPCVVSVLDSVFLGREYPSMRSWSGLGLIVVGAYGYALKDPQFQSQGYHAYFWPMCYLGTISFVMAYGKRLIKSVDLKTLSGPVLYTNLLGWPPLILFAQMGNEFGRFWEDLWIRENARFPPGSIVLLLLGSIIGTAIGYTSWWCRDKVSATSFTLIGVMNKCFTVFLNLLIWDNHAPPLGILSLGLCLLGGMVYQQAPMRKDAGSKQQLVPPEVANKDDGVWSEEVTAQETDEESGTIPLVGSNSSHGIKRRD